MLSSHTWPETNRSLDRRHSALCEGAPALDLRLQEQVPWFPRLSARHDCGTSCTFGDEAGASCCVHKRSSGFLQHGRFSRPTPFYMLEHCRIGQPTGPAMGAGDRARLGKDNFYAVPWISWQGQCGGWMLSSEKLLHRGGLGANSAKFEGW